MRSWTARRASRIFPCSVKTNAQTPTTGPNNRPHQHAKRRSTVLGSRSPLYARSRPRSCVSRSARSALRVRPRAAWSTPRSAPTPPAAPTPAHSAASMRGFDGRQLDDASLAAYVTELHDAGRASSSASMAVAPACFRACAMTLRRTVSSRRQRGRNHHVPPSAVSSGGAGRRRAPWECGCRAATRSGRTSLSPACRASRRPAPPHAVGRRARGSAARVCATRASSVSGTTTTGRRLSA